MTAPQTELIDETGRVVFRGTQSPGGGSVPSVVVVTFSAAQLAARWDGVNQVAGMALANPTDQDGFLGVAELANTLDNGVTLAACSAFDAGATSAQANGGETIGVLGVAIVGTYQTSVAMTTGATTVWRLAAGKAAYALYGFSADAPTVGASTIALFFS